MNRSGFRAALIALLSTMLFPFWANAAGEPVVIGLSAEFGMPGSQAAQSIEKGITLAIDEINSAGGVLGGRKLVLESRDDRGLPARAIDNFKDFAAKPEVVAVFCGRFSPVALEVVPFADKLGLLFLDPWAAADPITKQVPGVASHVFRLSLTDTWAMEVMLDQARQRKLNRVALMVPNTAWGRSGEAALLAYRKRHSEITHDTYWYNWGDTEFADRLHQAKAAGAQVLVMVANEAEGLPVVNQMAALPEAQRLPIISHWGILAGDFGTTAKTSLAMLDFSVVHTFSFSDPQSAKAKAVAAGIKRLFGTEATALRGQVGFAHAYDLTYLLAQAIDKAGSAERSAIRNAMERLRPYAGLVRNYQTPFSATRHEALERGNVLLGRFDKDGNLVSVATKAK
jgi:branched-chain amino acid transport system substrate-binding protein